MADDRAVSDDLARGAIRALLAGVRPPVAPVDCGEWEPYVSRLMEAFDRGEQSAVFWEFNLIAEDLALARLLAGDQPDGAKTIKTPPGTPANPRPLPVDELLDQGANDEGNAQSLYLLFGHEFLYCEAYGYLQWTGTHWRLDGAEAALERAAVYALKQRRILAARADFKHLLTTATETNARRVKDCLFLFRSLVTESVDHFDCDPNTLNCANGVLNLTTGKLTPHDPSQRYTYCVPVEYEPGADQRMWREFLADVVGGGPEVIEYLQMAIGYTLTGYTREECLFYIFGPTRSGKGTLTETLLALLPKPVAMEVDFTTFTAARDHDTQNFDLAPLKPARVLFASESNRYQALNSSKVKSLTGGNEVRCAFKHRDHFSYRPQYKMWLVSNHPVNADVDDDALWHRVKVLEFPTSFADREDTSLKLRMKHPDNLRGVLAWAVEGAIKWFALGSHGLGPKTPAAVATTTRQHRTDLDYVQAWLDECCEADPAHWSANEDVYRSYRLWCTDNGVEAKKVRMFMLSLKAKGFIVSVQRKINSVNRRGIIGLRVL
jgi:putative DNA primase/helicase